MSKTTTMTLTWSDPSYATGFAAYFSEDYTLKYAKDTMSNVYIKGNFSATSSIGLTTKILTMPVGYRPGRPCIITTANQYGTNILRIVLETNGVLRMDLANTISDGPGVGSINFDVCYKTEA